MGKTFALVQNEHFINYKNMPLQGYLSFVNLRYLRVKHTTDLKGDDKKKNSSNKPIDTRGIIPLTEFEIIKSFVEINLLLTNGFITEINSKEKAVIINHFIKIFYLAYDTGKYEVEYRDGEIVESETSIGSSQKYGKGQENNDSIGISGGKPDISISQKVTENNEVSRDGSGTVKRKYEIFNDLKNRQSQLSIERRQLVNKLNSTKRLIYPIGRKSEAIFGLVINMEKVLELNEHHPRVMGRTIGATDAYRSLPKKM